MNERERDALAAVTTVLEGIPGGHGLAARYANDCDWTLDPAIEVRRVQDGRRNVVLVQVGEDGLTVNRVRYDRTHLGEGLVTEQFRSLAFGPVHAGADAAFTRELDQALRNALDTFEPMPGTGIGTHPLTGDMVAAARPVLDALNAGRPDGEAVRMDLNVFGQAEGENDVLTFMRPDGSAMPVAVHTGYGELFVCNIDDNELIGRVPVHRGKWQEPFASVLQGAFDGLEPAASPAM